MFVILFIYVFSYAFLVLKLNAIKKKTNSKNKQLK